MRLEQSATLEELMRESIVFFEVACRAGQHKIGNVISWNVSTSNTADRECVIYVIGVFPHTTLPNSFKPIFAIIAPVPLPFQHFLNLLYGVCSWNIPLTGTSVVGVDSVHSFTMFSLVIPIGGCSANKLTLCGLSMFHGLLNDMLSVSQVVALSFDSRFLFCSVPYLCCMRDLSPSFGLAIASTFLCDLMSMCRIVVHVSSFNICEVSPIILSMFCSINFYLVLVIQPVHFIVMLFMRLIVSFASLRKSFFVDLIVYLVIFFVILFVAIIPSLFSYKSYLSYLWQHTMFSLSFVLASIALIVKTLWLSFIAMKELWCQWINLFAGRASSMSFGNVGGLRWFTCALFAIGIQAIWPFLVSVEELWCSGVLIRAFSALLQWNVLGYSVTHDKNQPFLSSALGGFRIDVGSIGKTLQGKTIFNSSNYSINPPEKPEEMYLW